MFILDTDRMLIGDIVLTAQDAPASKAIRKATDSAFSHAMLYAADHSYIHSDARGVHSGNTQRLLFGDESNATVLRLVDRNLAAVEMACTYARTQIGKQYSVPEAARSTFRQSGARQDASNRQFCSRLVGQAYAYAGVKLVQNPGYCYPGEFTASLLLRAAGARLRRATEAEIKFARSESPLELQTKATNLILERVRHLCHVDIQTFEQLVPFLLAQPQHDGAIVEIVKASGYLDFWKEDVLRNRWRYDVEAFLALPVSDSEKAAAAERELAAAGRQLDQFKFMHGQYMQLWARVKLSYFAIELQLYLHLVDLTKQRIEAAKRVLEKVAGNT